MTTKTSHFLSIVSSCSHSAIIRSGPSRIEEVMGQFEYWSYQFRDLAEAMGYTRSEAAVQFLLRLARGKGGLQNMADTWIEAMGRLGLAAARESLLGFIDPQIPSIGININFDLRNTGLFAGYVSKWARQDPALKSRLISLSEAPLTQTQRHLLSAIYHELGDDETLLAGVDLLQNSMSRYLMSGTLETLFVERRPYGSSGSFDLVPRNAEQTRAKLFQIMLNDPTRRQAAFSILGQVEVWRIELGRPPGEPRHPMIESGEPWPPLSFMNAKNKYLV
jgi:hypothetical protein